MDVILVASMAPNNDVDKHIGLSFIEQSLREGGINPILKHISEFDPASLKEDTIIGFSSYYECLDKVIEKAKESRKSSNHFIVIGGPGTYHIDTNKELLNTGLFDALNMGHALPFVETVKQKYHNPSLPLEQLAIENGLATQNHLSFKEGAFPHINKYPLRKYLQGSKVRFSIPPMRHCHNMCDYCIESKVRVPDLTDKIVEAIKEYPEINDVELLSFASPTFNKANIADAKKILSAIKHRPETAFYVDSSQLVQNMSEIITQLDEFNATHVYIGLNAIDQKSAKYIGRKIGNSVRTNIKAETEAVVEFLRAERKLSAPVNYLVSVMTSRADNKHSVVKLLRFVNQTTRIALEQDKKISVQIIQTIPYPGTEYAKNHIADHSMDSSHDYALDLITKKTSYTNKHTDFMKRIRMARYYLSQPEHSLDVLVGLNDLVLAYELVYEGEMKTMLYKGKDYKALMKKEKDFILNPEKYDK